MPLNELKPCPFCGNAKQTKFTFYDDARIGCDVCGALGPVYDVVIEYKKAITVWNRRDGCKKCVI